MRCNFAELSWDIVVVNDHPYMYCDMRVNRDSIPEGLIMYEVADADSDGRFCRISSRIMVNFLGTIVGKELLPMEDSTYYCDYDKEYDRQRDELIENLQKQMESGIITEHEYDDKLEAFEQNNFPEDNDGWFIEHNIKVLDYLENYETYLENIAAA